MIIFIYLNCDYRASNCFTNTRNYELRVIPPVTFTRSNQVVTIKRIRCTTKIREFGVFSQYLGFNS